MWRDTQSVGSSIHEFQLTLQANLDHEIELDKIFLQVNSFSQFLVEFQRALTFHSQRNQQEN